MGLKLEKYLNFQRFSSTPCLENSINERLLFNCLNSPKFNEIISELPVPASYLLTVC